DEIHIFGHGTAGEARLGTASLSLETLTTHSGTLAVLKDTLTEDGDILLYGCNIAAGEDGEAFIEELAELTAADIAASDDITGASGDWELEVNTGPIEADSIAADEYQHNLLQDGVASINSHVVEHPNANNFDARGNNGLNESGKFVLALEKTDITTNVTISENGNATNSFSNTPSFDWMPGSGTGSYTISQNNPVASYILVLNDNVDKKISNSAAVVTFDNPIIGIYAQGVKTINNSTFSKSGASYPSTSDSYVSGDGRDVEFSNNGNNYITDNFNSTGSTSSGGDWFTLSNNNRTITFGANNNNPGDFLRIVTEWPQSNNAPTINVATDVSGAVTELADGHANENTATITDTGYFTIADADNDSVSIVSDTLSSTTRSNGQAFGNLVASVSNNTSGDGAGQIDWTYSVDDADLDALNAGESYTETWIITFTDGTVNETQNVTVTINGVNDAPVVSEITDSKTEDAASFDTDLLDSNFVSDPDGDALSVTGTPSISATDGNGDYTLPANTASVTNGTLTVDPTKLNGLGAGESVDITVTYDVSDGTTTTQNTATITVTGVNDAPVAADINATVPEDKTTALVNAALIGPTANTLGTDGYQTGYQAVMPLDMSFSANGEDLFVLGADTSSKKIFTYNLEDAWNVDKWTVGSEFDLAPHLQSNFFPGGIEFNDDGTVMFVSEYDSAISDEDGRVLSFNLSTAYDLSTASYNEAINDAITIPDTSGSSRFLEPADGRMGLEFSSDGLSMFILEQHRPRSGETNTFEHAFKKFTLSTAWDISTADTSNPTVHTFLDSNDSDREAAFTFNGNGTRLFVLDVHPTSSIREYSVSSPYDISNLTLVSERSLDSEWFNYELYDIALSADESKLYLSGHGGGSNGGYIYEFSVNDSVLLNDTDPEGDTLTLTHIDSNSVSSGTTYLDGTAVNGQYGVLTIGADGTYRYVADGRAEDPLNAGDIVTDSFTYTLSDGAATDTANLVVTVTGINDAPTTSDATVTTDENTPIVLATSNFAFSDVDSNDTMTHITIGTLPTNGALEHYNGSSWVAATLNQNISKTDLDANYLRFTPATDEHGPAYTSFTFRVNDGDAYSTLATLTINVDEASNNAPIVTAQTNVNGTVTELVNGDPNEDTGTHTISGSFDIADSDSSSFTLSYEGSVQWASEISTFNSTQTVGTFTLSDQTVDGTGSIDWTYSIADHLIADQVTANGEVSYLSLDGGESFAETFTVTIDDGDGQTVTQDVVITVNGANDFDAQDDFGVIEEGGVLSISNGAEQLINNPITDASSVLDATFDGDENNRVDGVVFNNDGSQLYLLSSRTGKIQQHSLSTQFDVSTASSESTLYDGVNYSRGLVFSTDGEKAFTITPNTDLVYEYHLSTAFEIENMVLAETKPVSDGQGTNVRAKGLAFNSDGTKLYYIDQEGKQIIQEDLTSAFDITTASLAATFDIAETQGNREWTDGFAISPDGRKMFAIAGGNEIHEWILHTPDDITSATLLGVTNLGSAGYNLRGLAFSNDGSKLFFSNYTTGTSEDVVTRNTSVPFSVFYDELSHSGDVIDTNRSQTQDIGDNLAVASIRTGATEGAGAVGSLGTPLLGSYGSLT
ncbi:MAG: DUF4347 domain-containing protein, partial [Alphaproteobacteria bacterium]|nr:DUF4347 domain-containing protein [Alphaproteobacteria bacterium]